MSIKDKQKPRNYLLCFQKTFLCKYMQDQTLFTIQKLIEYILILLSAGFGYWFASYFKEKAKNYVSREDFLALQNQLRQNTSTVEAIKSDFGEKVGLTNRYGYKNNVLTSKFLKHCLKLEAT